MRFTGIPSPPISKLAPALSSQCGGSRSAASNIFLGEPNPPRSSRQIQRDPPKRPLTHPSINMALTSLGRYAMRQNASHEPHATKTPRQPGCVTISICRIGEKLLRGVEGVKIFCVLLVFRPLPPGLIAKRGCLQVFGD